MGGNRLGNPPQGVRYHACYTVGDGFAHRVRFTLFLEASLEVRYKHCQARSLGTYWCHSYRSTRPCSYLAGGHVAITEDPTVVTSTHDVNKNIYTSLFVLTIFGPDYYAPPK